MVLEAFQGLKKECLESLLRKATHTSSTPRPPAYLFLGMHPPRCILPSPLIVVAIVVEHLNVLSRRLNIVAECQRHVCIALVISICIIGVHSALLILSDLVAGFQSLGC